MSARRGIALVLALFVLLLVEAMAAGMLALTTQVRAAGFARMRTVRAQAAADAAVRQVMAGWQNGGFDTLKTGTTVNIATSGPAGAQAAATVERLSSASWLIRSMARVGGTAVFSSARAAALVATLDRAVALAEIAGSAAPSDSEVIGHVQWSEIESIADVVAFDSLKLTPQPGLPPLYLLKGDARISGTGEGLLIAAGTLTIEADCVFSGIIIARDSVIIQPGARVDRSQPTAERILLAAPATSRIIARSRQYLPAF